MKTFPSQSFPYIEPEDVLIGTENKEKTFGGGAYVVNNQKNSKFPL